MFWNISPKLSAFNYYIKNNKNRLAIYTATCEILIQINNYEASNRPYKSIYKTSKKLCNMQI